jgi:hypothetical protein
MGVEHRRRTLLAREAALDIGEAVAASRCEPDPVLRSDADETRDRKRGREVEDEPVPVAAGMPGSRPSCSSISAMIAGCDDELIGTPLRLNFVGIGSSS